MLNHDLNVNPNLNYHIIDKQIADAREIFLPVKSVRFNKHKHTNMDDSRYLKSYKIQRSFKTYLPKPIHSAGKAFYKTNLGTCNNILKKDIREAKKTYYCNEFNKYKMDIRKTWDTIKIILNHPVRRQNIS